MKGKINLIYDNILIESNNDSFESLYSFRIKSFKYTDETNMIETSKYNWLNFIPKILLDQMSKNINIYFIIICFLEVITF